MAAAVGARQDEWWRHDSEGTQAFSKWGSAPTTILWGRRRRGRAALTVDTLTHGNALTVDDAHGGFI